LAHNDLNLGFFKGKLLGQLLKGNVLETVVMVEEITPERSFFDLGQDDRFEGGFLSKESHMGQLFPTGLPVPFLQFLTSDIDEVLVAFH